ncbi:hypothetical protein ACVWXB_007486 [Streptomyces sp. TE12347]
MSLARWRALSPAAKAAHELARAATHANLPLLGTPMSRAVNRLLSARIRQNAFKTRPATRAGVMVSGGDYQGKAETGRDEPRVSIRPGSRRAREPLRSQTCRLVDLTAGPRPSCWLASSGPDDPALSWVPDA